MIVSRVILLVGVMTAFMTDVLSAGSVMVRESVIGVVDPDAIPDTIRVDVVSRRIVYAKHFGCCFEVAVVDGNAEEPYFSVDNFTFSPDGRHVSYQGRRDDLVYVSVDGRPGKGYVRVYNQYFSPDGKRVMYVGDRATTGDDLAVFVVVDLDDYTEREYEQAEVARVTNDGERMANVVWTESGQQMVFVDGRGGQSFDEIGTKDSCCWARQPVFSSDGRRVAYIGRRGAQRTVVVDGSEGRYYADVLWYTLQFTPDGRRVVYVAKRDSNKVVVVLNGAESGDYDEVLSPITFSDDSQKFAFAARRGRTWSIVVNGHDHGGYESVESLVFSPDGKRLVWVAYRHGKALFVSGGKEGPPFEAVGQITFSRNSQHVAYRAVRGGRCVVVLDGKLGKTYDHISAPLLSFDGSTLAYDVRDKSRPFVVINGREQRSYRASYGAAFSSDGRHFRYLASRGHQEVLIFDGKEQGPYKQIADLTIKFSANGDFVTYVVVVEDDKQIVVVRGKLGKAYKQVLRHPPPLVWESVPALSKDGTHFAYVADGDDYQVLVVDGYESRQFEAVVPRQINPHRLSNHEAIYAWGGGKLFRLEVDLRSQ